MNIEWLSTINTWPAQDFVKLSPIHTFAQPKESYSTILRQESKLFREHENGCINSQLLLINKFSLHIWSELT